MIQFQPIGPGVNPRGFFANRTKFQLVMGIILLSMLAGGCVRSIHPILKDEQVILDGSVVGKWVSANGNESIEVRAPSEDKIHDVIYTEGEGKKSALKVRLGKVGDLTIAEITAADPAPDAGDIYKSHIMRLYSLLIINETKPSLVISTVAGKEDWLKKYVAQHPGELQLLDDSIVTSSTEEFQAFILRHIKDEGFVGDKQTFTRPNDAAVKPAEAPAK